MPRWSVRAVRPHRNRRSATRDVTDAGIDVHGAVTTKGRGPPDRPDRGERKLREALRARRREGYGPGAAAPTRASKHSRSPPSAAGRKQARTVLPGRAAVISV
ncbi:hypothetical protein RKD28_003281 [Streptomyces sp. SAI-229]